MVIHPMTDEECVALLGRVPLARLACARADQPYVVPVSFSFDAEERCLYIFSTVGQKIDWMRDNPKVCVEVDEVTDNNRWVTVVIFGRFDEVGDSAFESAARRRAYARFQERQQWWLPGAARLASHDEHHVPVVFRVRIGSMSGRKALADGAS